MEDRLETWSYGFGYRILLMARSDAQRALEEAIEHLYRTFDVYVLPPYSEVQDLGVSPTAYEQVAAKPVRELTSTELAEYARHIYAITSWGSVGMFKYFLPRLCEVMVTEPASHYNEPGYLGLNLSLAGWMLGRSLKRRRSRTF